MAATVRGISIRDRFARQEADITEYVTYYYVNTDDKDDGPNVVLSAEGLPKIGDLYNVGNDFDQNAVVVAVTPRQREDPKEWEVEVTASNKPEDRGQDPAQIALNIAASPLGQEPDITYFNVTRDVEVPGFWQDSQAPPDNPQDQNLQKSVQSSNLEPPPYKYTATIGEPVCKVCKNYSITEFKALNINRINNTVNATEFAGFLPRQIKLEAEAKRLWAKVIGNYWQVCFYFRYRFDTWDLQVPNLGTFYWEGGVPADPWADANDSKRKVKRAGGRPVVIRLKDDGDKADDDETTFNRFRFYRELDFNTLNLNLNLD